MAKEWSAVSNYLPLPNGRLVHPYEIVALLGQHARWMREYQLTQKREDLMTLSVVPASPTSSQDVARLQTAVTAFLGQEVIFAVEIVPEIQLERSGKFRVCRSFVQSAYDGVEWPDP